MCHSCLHIICQRRSHFPNRIELNLCNPLVKTFITSITGTNKLFPLSVGGVFMFIFKLSLSRKKLLKVHKKDIKFTVWLRDLPETPFKGDYSKKSSVYSHQW